MDLHGNTISISGITSYRDCPRRFSYGRVNRDPNNRVPESEYAPESQSPATAYGRAIHDCIHMVEQESISDAEAIKKVFPQHARWLDPEDIGRMRADLKTYHDRDYTRVRTVAVEKRIEVPLFTVRGVTFSFNARLDRLYQSLDDPGLFTMVDYKSGKWRKPEEEVHTDPQFWAYNWAIHEYWPECERLEQVYDQLRFGTTVTSKSDEQREEIKEWLILNAVAILEDHDFQEDGLLRPTFNEWCPYCPLMESCKVVGNLSDFSLTRIAKLAPPRKDGRKMVLDLDPNRLGDYVSELEKVDKARKVLDRFSDSVKAVLKELPDSEREALGYKLQSRRNEFWTVEGLQAVHRELGDLGFYGLVSLSKSQLESYLAGEGHQELLERLLAMRIKTEGASFVTKKTKA